MGYIKQRLLSEINGIPQIRQENLISTFSKIRIQAQDCVKAILSVCCFPQRALIDRVVSLVAKNDRSRSFFKKNGKEDQDNILFAACDVMDLVAAGYTSDESLERLVVTRSNINRSFFIQVVEQWLVATAGYMQHAVAAAQETDPEQRSLHLVEMGKIENAVGCKRPESMYGVIAYVQRRFSGIRKLYERIVSAYCRLSLLTSRATAGSEAQENDSFQNGIFGLYHSVGMYDHTSPLFFVNFARLWVKQAILSNLKDHANTVKLSASVWQQKSALDRARQQLEALYGPLSYDELASKMEVKRQYVDRVVLAASAAQLKQIDFPLSSEDARIQRTTLPPNMVLDVKEEQLLRPDAVEVRDALPVLSDIERSVVCLYYGLLSNMKPKATEENTQLQFAIERLRQLA